jgi:hypothetical protein
MQTFYHGSSVLFSRFDLSYALEDDGKVKSGYGVYVTSRYRSCNEYVGPNQLGRLLMEPRDNGNLTNRLPKDALRFLDYLN